MQLLNDFLVIYTHCVRLS